MCHIVDVKMIHVSYCGCVLTIQSCFAFICWRMCYYNFCCMKTAIEWVKWPRFQFLLVSMSFISVIPDDSHPRLATKSRSQFWAEFTVWDHSWMILSPLVLAVVELQSSELLWPVPLRVNPQATVCHFGRPLAACEPLRKSHGQARDHPCTDHP